MRHSILSSLFLTQSMRQINIDTTSNMNLACLVSAKLPAFNAGVAFYSDLASESPRLPVMVGFHGTFCCCKFRLPLFFSHVFAISVYCMFQEEACLLLLWHLLQVDKLTVCSMKGGDCFLSPVFRGCVVVMVCSPFFAWLHPHPPSSSPKPQFISCASLGH